MPTGPATGDTIDAPSAGPRALRGGALRGGGYVLGVLVSLAAAPLLIRHLGVDEFGRYITVLSLVTLAGGLTEAGLYGIALREWATREGEERRHFMRNIMGIRLGLTTLGVALGVGFALVAGYSNVLVVGTILGGAGLLLQSVGNLLMVALQGELRFGWVSIVELGRQVVSTVLIVALVLAGAGLLAFFAVPIPAGLAGLVLVVALVHRHIPMRPAFHPTDAWPLVRDTLPYAAAVAVNVVYFRVAIIIMSLIATSRQTGYFATSFRVTEVLIALPALMIGAAFPILSRAARDDEERFEYATHRIFELSFVAGVWVVLAIELGAPFIIDVLAGSGAEPAVAVLRIQGLALLPTFVSVACGYSLLSLRRHRALLIANGAALATSIVFTLILVPPWEARGAALAAVIAETILAAGLAFALVRASRGRSVRLGGIPAIAIAAAAGGAIALAPGVHPVVKAIIGSAVYFAVIGALGRFPPELRHALQDVRPGGRESRPEIS